jgi:hypothetical protein
MAQSQDITPELETQGEFGVGMDMSNTSILLSLEKMNMPLNERAKYVINTVNYLLNKHDIGKFLEEEILLKMLHSSFFKLIFFVKFI